MIRNDHLILDDFLAGLRFRVTKSGGSSKILALVARDS